MSEANLEVYRKGYDYGFKAGLAVSKTTENSPGNTGDGIFKGAIGVISVVGVLAIAGIFLFLA